MKKVTQMSLVSFYPATGRFERIVITGTLDECIKELNNNYYQQAYIMPASEAQKIYEAACL